MEPVFEEIDFQQTPHGDISLRRRSEPRLDNVIIYEVKLNEEFLMSSLFTEAEIQLTHLALTELVNHSRFDALDVVIGGLGLGYTAAAALEYSSVTSINIIDVMQPVIEWHQKSLVPLGHTITNDSRCTVTHANFYHEASSESAGLLASAQDKLAHAVLLDIDHSPSHLLNEENNVFYSVNGLQNLANKIHPGGIFGLWSNEPPDDAFISLLSSVFEKAWSQIISFPNPYTLENSENTIYLATTHKN